MKELFAHYTVEEIIIIIVIIAAALKGAISFFDWIVERIGKIFNWKTSRELEKEKVEKLYQMQIDQEEQMKTMLKSINLLTESDKDTIKAWITEKHHHFCYEIKAIDYFSLDSINERYKHYKEENGNSYIDTLMNELKALPKIENDAILRTQSNYDQDKLEHMN